MEIARRPILWHIEVSHFSEKARWALDHKSVEHERRTPTPGMHIPVALWLTHARAATLPILELDGERIAGSDAIIAALEHRFPEPSLYPRDARQRRRALELAACFDHELGPYTRRLAFHELRRDPERWAQIAARMAPALVARLGPLSLPYGRAFAAVRYGAGSEEAAERARRKIRAALERLEAELDGGDYLVGERFTVADLTAAALLGPVVMPPEAPALTDSMPQPYERFRATLRERPAYRWVQEIFRRHRHSRGPTPADAVNKGASDAIPARQ
jgi:glutathione S-transferase